MAFGSCKSSGAVRFRAFSSVARGYVLALLIGLCLVSGGVGELPALLAIWLGGALLTLGLAAIERDHGPSRVPVRVVRARPMRGHFRH